MIAPSLIDRLAQSGRAQSGGAGLGPHAAALLDECLRAARAIEALAAYLEDLV